MPSAVQPGSLIAAPPSTNADAPRASEPGALRVNGTRLWDSLMALAHIGATPKGGVRRLALTALDGQARKLVGDWLVDAGCTLRRDAIGNVFAVRPGSLDTGAIAIGSHLDTQPSGGKFDGNYGVLAGLEVLRTLADRGLQTRRPLVVAIWTNEEGSRFTPVMMGSGVWGGAFALAHCLAQRDLDGTSVADALAAIGAAGQDTPPDLAAYFEPHIEQGPILEREGRVIGLVRSALGQRWFDVTVTGQDAHAGPTPLDMRRDALLAASRLVVAVREIAAAHPHDARGTVGQMIVTPNSRNVIPGSVRFTVDFRNADQGTLDAMVDAFRRALAEVAQTDKVHVDAHEVVNFPPCHFDRRLGESIERAAVALGHTPRPIASGAGHDAVHVARRCPAAMIFVPCEGGISHNEIENAQPAHLEAGANVLLHAVLEQAGLSAR